MKIFTRIKFLLSSLVLLAGVSAANAQVIVTQPTGGQGISNDFSAVATGAPTPTYVSLGDIVIAESAPGDFAAGASRTLTFDRPSTAWQFNVGAGTATGNGPNISSVSVTSVTAGRITVRYTITGPTDGTNSITISGVQVQSTTKTLGTEVSIFRQGGTGVINGLTSGTVTTGTKVALLSKVAGVAISLQTLLPGQINVPGNTPGRSGTVPGQVAGASFQVEVNAVDYAFNIVTTAPNQSVSLTSTNPYLITAGSQNLVSGKATFNVSLNTAGGTTNYTITATDVTDGSLLPNISSSIRTSAGSFAKLLVVLPGETLDPGSPTGKKDSPFNRVANATTPAVAVYAVDAFWNRVSVTANTYSVSMNTNDPLGVNPANKFLATNGSTSYSIALKTVGQLYNITATSVSDVSKLPYTTVNVNVVAGTFSRLQVLLPGETSVPYTSSGKTGTPTQQNAGVPFNITVNAVDANWNVITNGSADVLVGITNTTASDAATSALPADATLSAGTGTFSVTLRRAAAQSLRATNLTTTPAMAVASSANVTVNRGAYNKLFITLSGETYLPGTATGKGNTVTTIAVNAATVATVRAVDAYWNLVNDRSEVVELTSTDPNIVFATNNLPMVNGVRAYSGVRFRTAGSQTLTVSDGSPSRIYTTDPINVTGGSYVRLVLILPGETYKAGIAAGKEGTPVDPEAGQPFDLKVRAVDAYGNIVTDVNSVISFTATGTVDKYAQLPANTALTNGVLDLNLSATYRLLGGGRRLTAKDEDVASRSSQSPIFTVVTGGFKRLLIILPGETYDAGHPNGKTGAPSNRITNAPFNVTVRATDLAFNTITSVNETVDLNSNEGFSVNGSLVNGIKSDFSVTLTAVSYNPATTTLTASRSGVISYVTDPITVVGTSSVASNFFRSVVAAGDWNNSSSWESSDGVAAWMPATLAPTSTSKGITIRNSNTITITGTNATAGNGGALLVENGAQLILTSGRTLTISNGSVATFDAEVLGTLRSSGTLTINSGAQLQFGNSGKYQHAFTTTAGTIPTATWNTGSICEVVGYTTFAGDVPGSNQTFSDFAWNASAQTGAGSPSLLSGFVARDFTVTSTGAGSLNLGSVGGTTVITRDYLQTGGNVFANKTSGTQSLSLGGDFLVNGGNFALGNGTVNLTFNGGSQQLANAGTAIQFQNVNFTNGGTKTLSSGPFSVATTGILTMAASTSLNANGNLTLLSDATSTATVATIPSTSSITGNVTAQRFVSGGAVNPFRTYRMFSSPIHTGGNTYDLTQIIDDVHITGRAANGFDEIVTNTSAWYYDPSSTGFKIFLNTTTPVAAGNGVYLLYRGDRTSNLTAKFTAPTYSAPESVVMDFEGILNQQNVTVPLVYGATTNGFNFLGNPYASSLDWNAVISSGATADLRDDVIQIWNPEARQYATYDGNEGINGGSRYIASGQGFFVVTNTGGGSFTFTENHKANSMPSNLLMGTPVGDTDLSLASFGKVALANVNNQVANTPQSELRIHLFKDNTPYKIESLVVFKQGKSEAYVVREDARYAKGSEVFMSTLTSDNQKMAINYMPEINANSKVALDLETTSGGVVVDYNVTGSYKLSFNYANIPAGYLVKLNDNHLGTSSLISNGGEYAFNIDQAVATSAGANRFSVTFEAPTTLPVTYSSFDVAKVNEGVLVKWSTQTETNNNRFEVERAGDDKVFVKLHTEIAKGTGASYTYVDKNPLLGNNYYRLAQVDNDNTTTRNEPKVINYNGEINGAADVLSIFPNPVVANFTVKYSGTLKANQQTLKVVSTTGQVLLTKNISKSELLAGHDINISNFASGVYVVEIYENGAERLGQVKLIKR